MKITINFGFINTNLATKSIMLDFALFFLTSPCRFKSILNLWVFIKVFSRVFTSFSVPLLFKLGSLLKGFKVVFRYKKFSWRVKIFEYYSRNLLLINHKFTTLDWIRSHWWFQKIGFHLFHIQAPFSLFKIIIEFSIKF